MYPPPLVLQPPLNHGGMSPSPEALTSPLTPSAFNISRSGPQTRTTITHRSHDSNGSMPQNAHAVQHRQQVQPASNYTTPSNAWAGAPNSNVFSHPNSFSSPSYNSSMGMPAHQNNPSASRVSYDPNTSSFNLSGAGSGSGAGKDYALSGGSLDKSRRKSSTIAYLQALWFNKPRLHRLIGMFSVCATLCLVVWLLRSQFSTKTVVTNMADINPSNIATELSRNSVLSHHLQPDQKAADTKRNIPKDDEMPPLGANTPAPTPATANSGREAENVPPLGTSRTRDSATKKDESLIDKGLAEINRLKSSLKHMKQKVAQELSDKLATLKKDKEIIEEKVRTSLGGKKSGSAVASESAEPVTSNIEEEVTLAATKSNEDIRQQIDSVLKTTHKPASNAATAATPSEESQVGYFDATPEGVVFEKDKLGGYYHWYLTPWSACNEDGIQTRSVICAHTRRGNRISNRVCLENAPMPTDVRECPVAESADDATPQQVVEVETAEEKQKVQHVKPATPPTATTTTQLSKQAEAALESASSVAAANSPHWPTLAGTAPPFSAVAASSTAESCPVTRWGEKFISERWLQQASKVCGVDANADEHSSIELVRFPRENIMPISIELSSHDASHEEIEAAAETSAKTLLSSSQDLFDSFFQIQHGLFHPMAIKYSSGGKGKSAIKEWVDTPLPAGVAPYGFSFDCTISTGDAKVAGGTTDEARGEDMLRSRTHSDDATREFLSALNYFQPLSPPLVVPSDARSKSLFTRAFERLTEKEYDTTTIFIRRNCDAPFSAAQCVGDLFAVYSIAHTLKVEYSHIRIIFLDDSDETPYFPAWEALGGAGVFTKSQWNTLRAAPFDEEDVYITRGIFVVPQAVPTLFSLGESVVNLPFDPTAWVQSCPGRSALHQGFNLMLGEVFEKHHHDSMGDTLSASVGAGGVIDSTRLESVRAHILKHSHSGVEGDVTKELSHAGHEHVHHHLLMLAQGAGGKDSNGGVIAEEDVKASTLTKKGASAAAANKKVTNSLNLVKQVEDLLRLQTSGLRLADSDTISHSLLRTFPSLRISEFTSSDLSAGSNNPVTAAQLLSHARVLLAVRNSVLFNALILSHMPKNLHVIELAPNHPLHSKDRKKAADLTEAERLDRVSHLHLYASQGLSIPLASNRPPSLRSLVPHADSIFSARWICQRLGCGSFHVIHASVTVDEDQAEALDVPTDKVVNMLKKAAPYLTMRPAEQAAADAEAATQVENAAPTKVSTEDRIADKRPAASTTTTSSQPVVPKKSNAYVRGTETQREQREKEEALSEPAASLRAIYGEDAIPPSTKAASAKVDADEVEVEMSDSELAAKQRILELERKLQLLEAEVEEKQQSTDSTETQAPRRNVPVKSNRERILTREPEPVEPPPKRTSNKPRVGKQKQT